MPVDLFLSFGLFFLTAIVMAVVFLYLYSVVTPYNDYELIFEKNNIAASIGFGGAIVGVAVPMYSALSSSVSYIDFVTWGFVAIFIQLIFALIITRTKGKYSFEKHIEEGSVSVGVFMALLSISIGLINAGSMSY